VLSEGFLRCSANKYLHCVFPLDSLIICYTYNDLFIGL
jgi:hypothetical protein